MSADMSVSSCYFKFADNLDALDISFHWSPQARVFALNVWGDGNCIEVSRSELERFRDQISELLGSVRDET
jgi:hypothetical protein